MTACAIPPEGQEATSFGSMTRELVQLEAWLKERGVTHLAMESTGVYWIPLHNKLIGARPGFWS